MVFKCFGSFDYGVEVDVVVKVGGGYFVFGEFGEGWCEFVDGFNVEVYFFCFFFVVCIDINYYGVLVGGFFFCF